jgi:DNA-binding NtrC family response regulator
MPTLTVRDGARHVVRHVDGPVALDELCPSGPPVPYASGWRLVPEGAALVLVGPTGARAGVITADSPLDLGTVRLALGEERTASATERLQRESTARLVLALPDGRRVPLGTRVLALGRDARCEVVLADPTVSAVHCRVVPTREGWEIRDAGSANGTRVGGVCVGVARLEVGTTVTLGRTQLRCIRDPHDDAPAPPRGLAAVLVGRSLAMERVRADIARFAPMRFPVLIHGETGSGKELVARLLHERSGRARGPFVAINAGAIAPELVESELFGHERGAFTGAATRRRGVFEEASGGTLFLDELGELPLAQQAKLLRVLETQEVRRVGGEGSAKVDVRIVCATHRDLTARAAEGHFRADLLYRLDVLRVRLPPLRDRPEDLPELARHLMTRIAAEMGRPKSLDDAAVAALVRYPWPGNVRELFATLSRAAVEAEGERVGLEHLELGVLPRSEPLAPRESGTFTMPLPPPLPRELDGARLLAMVEACRGNLSRVARATGLARSTVRDRVERARRGGTSGRQEAGATVASKETG